MFTSRAPGLITLRKDIEKFKQYSLFNFDYGKKEIPKFKQSMSHFSSLKISSICFFTIQPLMKTENKTKIKANCSNNPKNMIYLNKFPL